MIHLSSCPTPRALPGLDCHPLLPGLEQLHLFKKIILFINIYLFLDALGLCCCAWTFSSCGQWGLPFLVACGLLIVVDSLVVERGL